ncbi:unnamed protein product [Cylindrotheca closterium]|uniref:Uncharacterized protein n=1 Tax=Cylindrotheca closterium TaxID=2856 RepID=A0AAD2G978_9STRA|nr:unnamed protein product [Cylindrotheca closterium]
MTSTTVMDQNNETVAFLRSREFSSALQSALTALNSHRTSAAAAADWISDRSPSDENLDLCILQCEMLPENGSDVPNDRNHHAFVFAHGIAFLPTIATDLETISPILIFNVALAYHLLADSQNEDTFESRQTLRKARKLYELTYIQDATSHNVLFQFAIRNNIAAIEQKIGRVTSVDECTEYLKSVHRLIDRGCNLRIRQLESFLMSIPATAETAAAA